MSWSQNSSVTVLEAKWKHDTELEEKDLYIESLELQLKSQENTINKQQNEINRITTQSELLLKIAHQILVTKSYDDDDIIRISHVVKYLSGGFNLKTEAKLELGNFVKQHMKLNAPYTNRKDEKYCRIITDDKQILYILKYIPEDMEALIGIISLWLNTESKPNMYLEYKKHISGQLDKHIIKDMADIVNEYM
jgi:hypothetical protein